MILASKIRNNFENLGRILTPVAREIAKFTVYPTAWQREQAAAALVQKYKFLTDPLDQHRGIASWVVLVGSK